MPKKNGTRYQSEIEATRRYDEKTYHTIAIRFRIEEDADIIADFEKAQEKGIKSREWIRAMFYNDKTK